MSAEHLPESSELPHISVCIPTYRRPQLLHRCLRALQPQRGGDFSYSVLVVDNDPHFSAQSLIEQWQRRSRVDVQYELEPVPNISLARNRAVAASRGELIAFIDDDECPEPTWLEQLYGALVRYRADGVLGPVLPEYEGTPPSWLVKSNLCVRRSFATGTALTNTRYMRTGNVLLRRNLFEGDPAPFDPARGRTGGEDAAFFAKMLGGGRSFVWCDEARVYEVVPRERQTRRYHLRRALLRGATRADTEPLFSVGTVRSVGAVVLYSASLPVLLLLGHHLFMTCLERTCDHLGKLLSHAGIRPVAVRTF